MEGPPLGPGGEDITWPDQVAPRGRKASSTRKIKPQTSNPKNTPQMQPQKATETYYAFEEITRVISKRSLSCPKEDMNKGGHKTLKYKQYNA